MKIRHMLTALATVAMVGTTGLVVADEPATGTADAPARTGIRITDDYTGRTTAVRASQLQGMTIVDSANEDIGTVSDLVLDPTTGKVKYAAVSVGGFLGIGDKMFAVPWDAIGSTTYEGYQYLQLNVPREFFESAPAGFNQDKWPDMADKDLERQLRQHYREVTDARRKARELEQKASRAENRAERVRENAGDDAAEDLRKPVPSPE